MFICCVLLGISIYVHIYIPLPFINSFWEYRLVYNIRTVHRMQNSIEQMVLGLPKEEIIRILGEPDSDGVFHAPGRGLTYIISTPHQRLISMNHEFLVIYLDKDLIAADVFIMNG